MRQRETGPLPRSSNAERPVAEKFTSSRVIGFFCQFATGQSAESFNPLVLITPDDH